MAEKKSLLDDCFASEYLPLRLITAVILFAALLSLSAVACNEYAMQISEQQVLGEIQRVERNALLLHRSGGLNDDSGKGSMSVLSLHLPESMSYAAFGTGFDLPIGSRSDEEANLYHYRLINGLTRSFSSSVKFCSVSFENGTPEPVIDKPAVLYSGSYDVYLEIVRVENQTYVTIFQRESLNAGR